MNGDELKRTFNVHELLSKIYADDRFPQPASSGDLRMFAITTVWVVGVERVPLGRRWHRVAEIMHLDNFRFWQILREDAPRYEPDRSSESGLCEAPMVRREGLCGKNGTIGFRVTNPHDGTWRLVSFCSRHQDAANQVHAAERNRKGIPEPLPNRGGLLPCYITLKGWPDIYTKARPGWKPPNVGICADDWPTMAKVVAASSTPPPPLKVVLGGQELDSVAVPSGESTAPTLKLVTT